MTSINSFYRDPNAALYVSALFSRSPAPSSLATSFPATGTASTRSDAGQRALARIIEILSLADGESQDGADVNESLGYVTGVSGTEGDENLTLTGRALYNVETGGGDDSLAVKTGLMANISTGDGNDSVKAEASAITGLDAGSGDDDVQLLGKLLMTIAGGDGNDTIKASGSALIGIDGGSGNDTLYLEGSRIFASGGTGDDTIDIHQTGTDSTAELTFAAGDGKDKVTTDGPLLLRFSGYTASDMTVSASKDRLTITFKNSEDRITLSLEGDAATGSAPAFAFGEDNGNTVLRIL
ncbi:RTX toxin [Rhizobium paknamense]|uniref:RTX toxin n=1 Tax=Rhizobium paknamense TaxID=1206817 RepID=A0ABU0I7F5_9HYPH|nr:RTX toxin [Rhizobium paknamense]MDQ0454151.1 hypothetical protein [Rhizobium paknamense]